MAFATGVSSSISALLTAVRAFAVSNAGFTDHFGSAWTSGAYTLFQMSKNGVYYTFQFSASEIVLNTATALGNTGLSNAQTGSSGYTTAITAIAGPHVAYWLFNGGYAGTGPCVHVVVEVVTNVFYHFSFGELEKHGTYTGGQYVTGSVKHSATIDTVENSNHVRPWDGKSGLNASGGHIRIPSGTSAQWGRQVTGLYTPIGSWVAEVTGTMYGIEMMRHTYNDFNNRAPLIPIEVHIADTVGTVTPAQWIPMGNVAGVASVNTKPLAPKQTVLSDWQVFPVFEKSGVATAYPNGKYYGLAYKR